MESIYVEDKKRIFTSKGKRVKMDKKVKVVYNKLENLSFNDKGYIDLSESIFKKKNDLVNVCNIFRDPRYETFRIFYMKKDKIIGQEAITSKIPNAVVVFFVGKILSIILLGVLKE